jgi:hypothetical protein
VPAIERKMPAEAGSRSLRHAFVAGLFCLVAANIPAAAASNAACKDRALDQLKTTSPGGFLVYQEIKDKEFFKRWIDCSDAQLGLPTAVHESVHHLTQDHDAFPLLDLSYVKRPHDASKLMAPSVIAGKFAPGDLVASYLTPGASSAASDFLYLLDELNAYTHDLDVAVALDGLRPHKEQIDSRDGLAALMAFVAIYVETAEESHPKTWSGLQQPEVATTVTALWSQAERVMNSSCGIANFGHDDKKFIRQFCADKAQASLAKILGRAPMCPVDCLSPPKSAVER